MAITVLPSVKLVNGAIYARIQGRDELKNERVEVDNGTEYVNGVWVDTRREWDFGSKPMLRAHFMQLMALHEVTGYGRLGFLMLDPKDHVVLTSGISTGVAHSLGGGDYQLDRRLTEPVSGLYTDRGISRPMVSGFSIYVSGLPLGGGDYTLDEDTGIVTIAAAPAAANIRWAGKFYVPVHFLEDTLPWDMLRPASDPDNRLFSGPTITLREILEVTE